MPLNLRMFAASLTAFGLLSLGCGVLSAQLLPVWLPFGAAWLTLVSLGLAMALTVGAILFAQYRFLWHKYAHKTPQKTKKTVYRAE